LRVALGKGSSMYSQGVAQYYDLFSDDPTQSRAETAFIRAMLPKGRSILDIGAGIGNLAFALAADGYQVTALEPDPEMYAAMLVRLALRRDLQGRLTPVPKALGFTLNQSFDACISLAVLHLLDEAGRAAMFRYAYAQLRAGGCLIVEEPVESPLRVELPYQLKAERTFGDTRFQHFYSMNQTPHGRWCTTWEFLTLRGEVLLDRRTREFDWKPGSRGELLMLAENAGFVVEAEWADFERAPFAEQESKVLIQVARKPA
jgi:SAM-dependent methyltransferase